MALHRVQHHEANPRVDQALRLALEARLRGEPMAQQQQLDGAGASRRRVEVVVLRAPRRRRHDAFNAADAGVSTSASIRRQSQLTKK